ncbi:hypothetical protein COW36_15145 [bacterium (Candidatus Blackallbacteria) CG17_big_fil_post_rev_8_21_14_2_50_48_46]|uniref:Uncharacterized protein n=1 Tax=bacterium (Candidatus Blackallbacteria) CG17_big_fil_post_rev_8_21_14_2_50_48_46 TaxID=2014261 RepID=A0A2M7G2L7_9BACT|nr:MAG: hypothetical protein COW64_11405 [bacterium (Candidatus Blackallbacteria) CG18_big_fil_WC_8_21_14_2_50_49_26]PIW16046.1 MAG: hypothetical protein COW36_15145 [bacterium (Candidatus Blackallbacteria) CG17_big_fil_post_rev_8_21_14_2_50_48_46]PIW50458.1 MAG: hypothetical protein COW20_02860 [bacterium (Candidatus Blackallbacteria) CG13_big_fil_rev_8_21_14_2_50_49_14]
MDFKTRQNLPRPPVSEAVHKLKKEPEKQPADASSEAQKSAQETQALAAKELPEAFLNHQLKLETPALDSSSQPHLEFIDPPAQAKSTDSRPERPSPFLSGAKTLGISSPDTELLVDPSKAKVDTGERNLDQLTENLQNPDQVAAFLDAVNYDQERGKPMGGDGPLGAQKPEDTLSKFSGVCRDIHQLGAYILSQNGYQASQVGYVAGRTSHSILAYAKGKSGYGIVEYGRNYSPEEISKLLGRPALSPREAVLALRPEAKVIFGWTPPEKGKEGSVKDIYYTMGHQLYQESLKLKHQDHLSVDYLRGIELEKTLGKHWSLKLGQRGNTPGDPTGKNASYLTAGYQWGDFDNWGRISVGAQYRPHEGAHVVGPNTWDKNPTTLLGANIEGKLTPFKANLSPQHRTSTTVYGSASGAFAAFNQKKESDAGVRVNAGYGFDMDILSGLPQANLRLSQNFDGNISKNLSYHSEVFMDNDLYLATAAYGMGGKGLYANIGVNGSLNYTQGPWNAYLGAQYLFQQVNNLEASGVSAGMGYKSGRLSFGTGLDALGSEEGLRIRTHQQVGVDLTERANFFLQSSQEKIQNENIGDYSNPGSFNIGAGFQVKL